MFRFFKQLALGDDYVLLDIATSTNQLSMTCVPFEVINKWSLFMITVLFSFSFVNEEKRIEIFLY